MMQLSALNAGGVQGSFNNGQWLILYNYICPYTATSNNLLNLK